MFWMNMIDAFYQSLVCFFIPYFVSLLLTPVTRCLAGAFDALCLSSLLFSPSSVLLPGLC